MDAEAIRVSTAPPVRSRPPSPSVAESGAPLVSAEKAVEVESATEGDIVTLSNKVPTEPRGEARVSTEKVSGGTSSSQTRLEVTDKNEVVLQVIDSNTGQVIKEIPAREQQRLSRAIHDSVEQMANNSQK